MSVELKPCPFCGHSARKSWTYRAPQNGASPWMKTEINYYTISCCKCNAEMKGKKYASLVKAWNRRAET